MTRFNAILVCLLAWSLCVALSPAAEPKPAKAKPAAKSKFVRVTRDKRDNPLSLDTAIVRYVSNDPKKDLTVDLIGAVHIGEKAYYEQLNKDFEQYDVLLYELVAPEEGLVPKPNTGSSHPVSILQNGMKDMLELEHQLQYVDYDKENFVHADMSAKEFSKSMADRGESIWTMMFRMMGQQMANQNKNPGKNDDLAILMALFDKDRALRLKRIMAEQFEDMEGAMSALDGPEGSTLITERNKVALKVLDEQIADGKKKIGIFYGAGHMNDMEERLLKEHGLRRDSERWLVAWNLQPKQQQADDQPRGKKAADLKRGAKARDKQVNQEPVDGKAQPRPNEAANAKDGARKEAVRP